MIDAQTPADAAAPAQDVPRFPPRPAPSIEGKMQMPHNQTLTPAPAPEANWASQPAQTRGDFTISLGFLFARPLRTLFLLALLASVAAVAVKHHELRAWWRVGGAKQPVVYALSTVMPDGMCDELSPDDIRNGTARDGTVKLRDMRASLLYWMEKAGQNGQPLQGICARYLEQKGVCYCIVNMVRAPDEPENLVDMYNMEVIGTSPGDLVRNYERSVLCKSEVESVRFAAITVRWLNNDGVMRERDVGGLAAQTIQQIDDVQRGEGSCRDSNIEVAIASINRKVNELRMRTMHNTPGNVALLSAEQAHRYQREHNSNRRQLAQN